VLIAFVGSVFSPYYAWQRRRGAAPAEAHCAFNLSLYRRQGSGWRKRWSMTERPVAQRSAQELRIGASRLAWGADGHLRAALDEREAPWPRRLQARLDLQPGPLPGRCFALLPQHHWQPIAPAGRLRVQLPDGSWEGDAYLDANWGERPLEADFRRWHWCRESTPQGRRIRYAVEGDGGALDLSLGASGELRALPAEPLQSLPRSAWGLRRALPGGTPPLQLQALEDGPFYCRSLLQRADGWALHETLDLQRFARLGVQALLPFRMPRWPLF
jgi:carotenoid 1,2-hydratase